MCIKTNINNDFLFTTQQVERSEDEDYDISRAVKVMATVNNDTSKKWQAWQGVYFLKPTKQGTNQFLDYIQRKRDSLKVNAFDRGNHKKILEDYPGSNEKYDDLLQRIQEDHGRVRVVHAYQALVWAVSAARQELACDDDQQIQDAIMCSIEGNNRVGALEHLLLLSEYNAKDGSLKCNTLKKPWFVKHLGAPVHRDVYEITESFKDISIEDLVEEMVTSPISSLNKDLAPVRLWYGKTTDDEAFQGKNIPMSLIAQLDRVKSRNIANDKQESVEPGENVTESHCS